MKEYDKENKSEMKSTNHCNNKTSRNVTASRKDKTTYSPCEKNKTTSNKVT